MGRGDLPHYVYMDSAGGMQHPRVVWTYNFHGKTFNTMHMQAIIYYVDC